ncbi:hypothetical protein [Maribacter antarcticus]|uniref:hypothetical protein n=1 Tax=Maribacter antarcticus TaxID=505250 RepID=UPI000B2B713D|nr:hypothetical protein [Maribacter antarcticus]
MNKEYPLNIDLGSSGFSFSPQILMIGYYMLISKGKSVHWSFLELLVNGCFYPVDGANHCDTAYRGDSTETFLQTNWLAK